MTRPLRPRVSSNARAMSSSPFKPWPDRVIECNGDYRRETYLEKHIGGPLYKHQSSLPRLPIPSLEETMQRFLPTALPLTKSDEERQSLEKACSQFPSEAALLQQRLHQRRDVDMQDSSWLQLWWNQMGYLQVRDTVVINVSYFFQFADDPTATSNITRGATILFAAAEFRRLVCSGQFPAETVGKKKTALCSTAFKYMFNACRIPKRIQDTYRIYDPSRFSHAVVARKGHFFSIKLCDESGMPVALGDLQTALERVIEAADNSEALEIGILTSNDRDSWADAREALLEAGGVEMAAAMEELESGALLLCLDEENPVSRRQFSELLLYGGEASGSNRWFDKSIQIICTENGKAGLLGEHSMMDGMPVVQLADHICKTSYANASSRSLPTKGDNEICNIFSSFNSKLQTRSIENFIREAQDAHITWTGKHELHVQSFQGYGSSFIKKAGFSPDAFVQIAMQLATFRLWGEQGGTYEATQVRPFLHGRTETTRTVSEESEAFVKIMGLFANNSETDDSAREEKIAKLEAAVQAHVKYIGNAAKGLGVDRHLFGLSLLVADGEKAPALYSLPAFVRSKTWRVSTSNLTHPKFDNWGYGEVTTLGVGLSYSVHGDHCMFCVTSLKEHGFAEKLSHILEEALLEMKALVQIQSPKSRL
eukprot:CAMPEP_0194206622 /NCGR_PEP_ID=MMETSP0156-20130528/5591_1 /TAXON_ID=33649 /ORGANISM="Thalassionema nitzschioides, Strain L26-B" /LENGTH=652 /DNA_ID=CAMNT_0038933183 /DNA_START=106 /DNA_END=2064 /DNA_ORIENTATION=+